MIKTAKSAICVFLLAMSCIAGAQPKIATPAQSSTRQPGSPLFTFETDELWLNLHHFLWTLGRAEAGIRDNTRQSAITATDAKEGWSSITGIASPGRTSPRGHSPSADFTATLRGAEASTPG